MNVNKLLINGLIAIILSMLLASFTHKPTAEGFLNTIYTISGIMFSIGMGILCTLNPDSIKNEAIYKRVKTSILKVRNSYLMYFAVISIPYLIYQLLKNTTYIFEIKNYKVVFDLYYLTATLNIISIVYVIIRVC